MQDRQAQNGPRQRWRSWPSPAARRVTAPSCRPPWPVGSRNAACASTLLDSDIQATVFWCDDNYIEIKRKMGERKTVSAAPSAQQSQQSPAQIAASLAAVAPPGRRQRHTVQLAQQPQWQNAVHSPDSATIDVAQTITAHPTACACAR